MIAPSSPFDRTLALRGLAWLGERFGVIRRPGVFARSGYLAGDDDRRADELNWALASGARAIVAMRGGYGVTRILGRLDWTRFSADPCWLVGFSDITALHLEVSRRRIASVHGPMVCGLGRGDARTRDRWLSCLGDPGAARGWSGLATLARGAASGPLFGGNLTLLHCAAAAGRLEIPVGAVLLLEDVGERPYRIDRMLCDLDAGGHLAKAAAVIVGDFTACTPGRDGREVRSVLEEHLAALRVPVVAGLPVGHELRNDPLVLGAIAEVSADLGTLVVGADLRTS